MTNNFNSASKKCKKTWPFCNDSLQAEAAYLLEQEEEVEDQGEEGEEHDHMPAC